jgi:UDP-N-acetylmuramoyl-tripeptide--D-alanyl-D-alanine ligase
VGTRVTGVSTDTRSVGPGQLFVALRGERFDAHDFIGRAIEAGASALMVERWSSACRAPALVVPDTRRALGEIARGWRRQFTLPVIGVTGSNGKTTVKEMIAAILSVAHGESGRLATRGNLNNDIGVRKLLFSRTILTQIKSKTRCHRHTLFPFSGQSLHLGNKAPDALLSRDSIGF